MWRFLLFLALAIGIQGVPSAYKHIDEKDLLKHLEYVLQRLQRDDGEAMSSHASSESSQNDAANGGSESDGGSKGEMPGSSMEQILLMIEQQKPELLSMYINDVEDISLISSTVVSIGEEVSSHMQSFKPCMAVADLIGAIRFAMINELQPGMYETLHNALDHVMMETGHMIASDRTQLEHIQYAIFQPVYMALEQLECDIKINMDCPGPNDIGTVTAPRSSPSEQLYWTMDHYLNSVDMNTKSVGEIVAGILSLWSKFVEEKYAETGGSCDHSMVTQAPMILKAAIDQLSLSMVYDHLFSRISAVVSDQEIARSLTELLIKNHFVDDYLTMRILRQGLEEAETEGFEHAVMKLSAYVLSLMYESSKDHQMLEMVFIELHKQISSETLLAPLYTLDLQNYIDGSDILINSIAKYWQSPCLNARLVGVIAGITEIHKSVALMDPRTGGVYAYALKELGVSILNPTFQQTFDAIVKITVTDVFKPFTDVIHDIAGPQPSEVVFIELEKVLSRPDIRFTKVHDMLMAVAEIVVPVMGHEHKDDMESPYKCIVSDGQLVQIMEEAFNLKHSLTDTTMIVSDVKQALISGFPSVPSDKINAIAAKIVEELVNVVMRDTLVTLQFFEDVESTDVMSTLIHFLAVNSGFFVHSVLQKHPDSQAPIMPPMPPTHTPPTYMPPTSMPPTMYPPYTPPTSMPGHGGQSALDYLQWQQQLVASFVMQYMSGMVHYNMASVSSNLGSSGVGNPCTSMSELCDMLQEHLIGVVKDYGPFVKRGIEILHR